MTTVGNQHEMMLTEVSNAELDQLHQKEPRITDNNSNLSSRKSQDDDVCDTINQSTPARHSSRTTLISPHGTAREFRNLAFWRDVLAEFVATFVLVSIQAALPLTWGKQKDIETGTLTMVALGMGFIVCTMAWALGDFGGAHMNPAVSISMAVMKKISYLRATVYVAVQCTASIVAVGFIFLVVPAKHRDMLAATTLHPDVSAVQGFFIELWITFILVLTILGSTNSLRKDHLFMPTIPIGFAVSVGIMAGGGPTGASMNPARSLGPAVVISIWKDSSVWDNHWVYWFGPIAGGLFATLIYVVCLDKADRHSDKNDPIDVVE